MRIISGSVRSYNGEAMTSSSPKINLLDLDRKALEAFFAQLGEKPFRASQVMKWIYQLGLSEFADMSNLSKALRNKLDQVATITLPQVALELASDDGSIKWVLQLDNYNRIEMVYIPEKDRGTLCVSSQVGCTLACSFCSTAQQGFNRNLTTAEIIGQVVLAARLLATPERGKRVVTNVVMMGMGEPLLNFDAVVAAMDIMQDDFSFGISKRRLTISTSGVVPAIDRLGDVSDVSLAISLHATNDRLRDVLVPINKKYPLQQLIASCQRFLDKMPNRRRITFEYVMLQEINDRDSDAKALITLLQGVPAKVNLIPFNPFPGTDYRCSDRERILRFQQRVMDAGIVTTIRKTRGDDITAACGQLVGDVADRTRRSQRFGTIKQELVNA